MIDNILGNKALIRILRFLYLSPNRYFSFLEIEKYVGVGREGIKYSLKKLEFFDMIYINKNGGKKYKIKLDNPLIVKLNSVFEYEKSFFQGIDPMKLNAISNFEQECIQKIKNLKKIFLFGSVAKGKSGEKSDIDFLILVENGKNNSLLKIKIEEIKEKYERKYEIQTIIMDENDFKMKKNEALVKEILNSGINL